MAKTLFSYISDILHSEGNVTEELGQVMASVMDGKSEDERRVIVEGLMKDGMMKEIANKKLVTLITVLLWPAVPATNEEGLDLFEVVDFGIKTGYCLGATMCGDCYDDDLQFSYEKAKPHLEELFNAIDQKYPSLCYIKEDDQNLIRNIITCSVKMAVEHTTKGEVLNDILSRIYPNWQELGGFSEEEIKELYTPQPFDMPPYQDFVDARFKLYEHEKQHLENLKSRKQFFHQNYMQDDEEVIKVGNVLHELMKDITPVDELDMTPEGILSLPPSEQLTLFLFYTRTYNDITKEEAYKAIWIGFVLYDVIKQKFSGEYQLPADVIEKAIIHTANCVAYYIATQFYPDFKQLVSVLEMSTLMVLAFEKQNMIETSDKNRIRRAKYVSSLHSKIKDLHERNKKAMQ